MKVRKAVIPAAGPGTRFLPATKAQAKEMLPIAGKPAIEPPLTEVRRFRVYLPVNFVLS